MPDMNERVELLERHVLNLDREQPGLVIRVDRLEWFVRALLALVSLGVVWKVVDVAGQFIASQALKP
jgi:hypothetical protein